MARSDLLRLQPERDFDEVGIHIQRHKTAGSSGKRTIYEWTDELREAIADAIRARQVRTSKWLFCTLDGDGYIDEETGQGGPVQWNKMGDGWSWSRKKGAEEDHAQVARDGWAEIKRRVLAEEHDLYILDEFAYPVKWGWIDAAEVADFLAHRPGHQHVVITGRDVAPEIIEVADLVTEMTKIKHPMDAGQKGQRGIEW